MVALLGSRVSRADLAAEARRHAPRPFRNRDPDQPYRQVGGVVTVDGIERYLAGELRELPEGIKFYWADVPAGDVIYVPWRFFHQVYNVTESIALSRYYVARENYQASWTSSVGSAVPPR